MNHSLNTHLATERKGASIIELMIFIVLAAMMALTILPLLFNATESRQRQDAIALVEQNGAQIMQTITQEIRAAERILDPPTGGTGFIIALQTSSGSTNPTIIARHSGAIMISRGRVRSTLSSDLVGVTHFAIDNTSTAADRQSVTVSLGIRRIIRLHRPLVYTSQFDAVVNLYPDDVIEPKTCTCPAPYCDTGSGTYVWGVCNASVCVPYADFQCVYES